MYQKSALSFCTVCGRHLSSCSVLKYWLENEEPEVWNAYTSRQCLRILLSWFRTRMSGMQPNAAQDFPLHNPAAAHAWSVSSSPQCRIQYNGPLALRSRRTYCVSPPPLQRQWIEKLCSAAEKGLGSRVSLNSTVLRLQLVLEDRVNFVLPFYSHFDTVL